jgi:hypothetical protein
MSKKAPRKIKVIRRKLGREKADGLCTFDGKVHVDERLRGIRHMETLLHELLHNEFPFLSEEAVTEASRNMATTMYNDHWRRVEK